MRIAVVAPSCTLKREAAAAVQAIVTARADCELVIHPQCFLSEGHFAGPDEARLLALLDVMADGRNEGDLRFEMADELALDLFQVAANRLEHLR